jgi:hypothetical protein
VLLLMTVLVVTISSINSLLTNDRDSNLEQLFGFIDITHVVRDAEMIFPSE